MSGSASPRAGIDAAEGIEARGIKASSGVIHNPGFALTVGKALEAMRSARGKPVRLARPVVVLDGWHSPGVPAWGLSRRLCGLTSGRGEDFAWVTYPWAWSVDVAARHAMGVLERGGLLGREVDLIGISMGGIVARALASGVLGVGGPDSVRAVRVFTLASPHRGARLAKYGYVDRASAQLRAGSDVLRRLDDALPRRGYELTCYALLRDWLVGARQTAPMGMEPHWVDPQGFVQGRLSHFMSIYDARIQIDLARRLRGEEAFAKVASAPPRE
ncbi:hypothetical protein PHYC_02752 [Phycisphaerales bacterium]|nr:hypothetical protein PHYC_02752 [Phycisphaerales bacterium]